MIKLFVLKKIKR